MGNNDKSVMHRIIEHGRIAEWIISAGGISLCIIGGSQGFLDADAIFKIVAGLVAGVFGIELLNNKGQ